LGNSPFWPRVFGIWPWKDRGFSPKRGFERGTFHTHLWGLRARRRGFENGWGFMGDKFFGPRLTPTFLIKGV